MPSSRFILAPIEQVALGAIREERLEVAMALADRLAPFIEEVVETSQDRVVTEAEADDVLLQVRDEFVGRSMTDMESWGEDEALREPVVELLARHLLAEGRVGFVSRVIMAKRYGGCGSRTHGFANTEVTDGPPRPGEGRSKALQG